MKNAILVAAGAAALALGGATYAAQGPAQPAKPMTFFITSVGKGQGGNLGGIAGADAHCQQLAVAVGRGAATWRAYLSTQGPGAVNARDRVGTGPWHNARGQEIGQGAAQLHGDTLELARLGNTIGKFFALTETGGFANAAGDEPMQHDILTGSTPDGRAFPAGQDKTCSNWTSAADGQGSAQVGHFDKQGGGNGSWNSAHGSRGCSQANLATTGGAGLLYCFAVN